MTQMKLLRKVLQSFSVCTSTCRVRSKCSCILKQPTFSWARTMVTKSMPSEEKNNQIWHEQRRWSSGWGCTDLPTSCRTGTAPWCDLLVDKHTNLCLRPLVLPQKKSLPLCFSAVHCLCLEMYCLSHCFLTSDYFLTLHPLPLSSLFFL